MTPAFGAAFASGAFTATGGTAPDNMLTGSAQVSAPSSARILSLLGLTPLSQIEGPEVSLDQLRDLRGTQTVLMESGLL